MARGGFPGGFGGGNMNNLMKQAQKLQKEMEEMQKNLENSEYEASVGGGAVVDDVEMLEDLVLSAVNEALKKAEEASSNQMGKLTGGLNIPGLF